MAHPATGLRRNPLLPSRPRWLLKESLCVLHQNLMGQGVLAVRTGREEGLQVDADHATIHSTPLPWKVYVCGKAASKQLLARRLVFLPHLWTRPFPD